MSNVVIKVENLSKLYRLGEVGTGTISHDLNRWWAKVRGKEDPYAIVGQTNDRTQKATSDYVWALKDINFEVKQGDVVGIIGRNGAGKSTLLKLLSRVTSPTTGGIKYKGRIASLLEVGTGMHPELTGRENIFLNGTIMGMTKTEIQRKFDEIVDFAGCAMYVDTPVKRYSSGMKVRLGFAVAAFLEPEILIVDEVLAVGDAEFQNKAIGKMQDVSKGEGRTVLFVSHNMGAVRSLCRTGIVMKNGSVAFHGTSNQAINDYLSASSQNDTSFYFNNNPSHTSDVLEVSVRDEVGKVRSCFKFDECVHINFKIKVSRNHLNATLGFRVKDNYERNIFTSEILIKDVIAKEGEINLIAKIPSSILVPNQYEVNVAFHIVNTEIIRLLEGVVKFEIEETGSYFYQYSGRDYGCVFVNCEWIK